MGNYNTEDLTGKQFYEWTVLKRSNKQHTHGAEWTCQCSCGFIRDIRGSDLRRGNTKRCKACAAKLNGINKRKPKTKKIINYVENHPRIENISGEQHLYFTVIEYDHSDESGRTWWKCQCNCGKTFISRKDIIQTDKIISCGCLSISKGELKILTILQNNNINFQQQYSFSNLKDILPLRFDFAIFDTNNNLIKVIEFQGEQHYTDSNFFQISLKQHDILKRNYCKEHNIPLLEIPYWDYDKISIEYLLGNN